MHDPYAGGRARAELHRWLLGAGRRDRSADRARGTGGLARGDRGGVRPFEELLPDGFASQFETLGEEWAIAEHTSNRTRPAGTPTRRSTRSREAIDGRAGDGSERSGDRQAIDPADVEAITVRTFANATDMSHAEPETMTAGKFSAPYVLATYLCRGASTSTTSRPRRWPTRRFSPWPHASNSAKTTGTRRRSRVVGSECRRRTARRDDSDRCARLPRGRLPRPHSRRGVSRSEPCAPGARARRGREHNARVDEALDALDAVAERPVRSTVDTLRP